MLNTPRPVTQPASIKEHPDVAPSLQLPSALRQASTGPKGALAPSSFYCPISMELMADPCMLATGHTYERVPMRSSSTSTALSTLAELSVHLALLADVVRLQLVCWNYASM